MQVLESVADETGVTVGQIVLAWMLQSEPGIVPLMAASLLAQLEEDLGSLDVTLTNDHLTKLNAAA